MGLLHRIFFCKNKGAGQKNEYSFKKIEQLYYFEHYADHIQVQNERNEKTRYTEHNRIVTDLLINNKTCPEESIYQISIIDESILGEILAKIVTEFFAEIKEKLGTYVHILDWALHLDEGTLHIQERHVLIAKIITENCVPNRKKYLNN